MMLFISIILRRLWIKQHSDANFWNQTPPSRRRPQKALDRSYVDVTMMITRFYQCLEPFSFNGEPL